ncbi:hypothetical protein BRC66_00115 [Halobacteriales archaeon QH_2_66_30]|nr:MAG: hypothetical protein BRC66_00115 [Halobacteriales archaeon QH_2_66_30]
MTAGATLLCDTGDTLAPGLLSMETGGELVLPFYEAVGVDIGVESRMTAVEDTASEELRSLR